MAAPHRVVFLGEQTEVVAEIQPLEQGAGLGAAAGTVQRVDEPEAARQERALGAGLIAGNQSRVYSWMRRVPSSHEHHRAIHGAGAAPFTPPSNMLYTQRADGLYARVLTWPLRHLHRPGLAGKVAYAQLLQRSSTRSARVTHR
jgi:hypothetical protein